MSVSAVVVTRGDVDISPIIASLLPVVDEILIWDNSGEVTVEIDDEPRIRWLNHGGTDIAVYGRYAAIGEAEHPLIFCQDDDCVLAPASIEEIVWQSDSGNFEYGRLVCNMPTAWREQDFYADHCLVGFGACFQRDLPMLAFKRFEQHYGPGPVDLLVREDMNRLLLRTCDIVFTALTPRVLVDVPYENLPWASDANRMWKQPEHVDERTRMLDLVRRVRDA